MDSDEPADGPATDGGPQLVGHVHLKVRLLHRAVDFYTDILGLSVTDRHSDYAFLSFGERHHDVALQAVGEDAPAPGPGVGLYHAAFEVEELSTLSEIADRLRERDTAFSPIDHGISKTLYFDDPDGNGLEVYVDTRATNDHYEWEGTNEPFDPHDP
jgi:catechol 2,3-dioxygenase